MTVPQQTQQAPVDSDVMYCTVHPTIATGLRCNRCGRPMCTKCARLTPVGYRCKECVRQQQDKFFDAQFYDYILVGIGTLIVGGIAAFFMSRLGFFFLAFFIGPAIGGAIGRIIFKLTRKRRGRYMGYVVGACLVASALPFFLANPISVGIYLFLATSVAVGQVGLKI
jgi:hypothetical protein